MVFGSLQKNQLVFKPHADPKYIIMNSFPPPASHFFRGSYNNDPSRSDVRPRSSVQRLRALLPYSAADTVCFVFLTSHV